MVEPSTIPYMAEMQKKEEKRMTWGLTALFKEMPQ
jgi:hypothetical protein